MKNKIKLPYLNIFILHDFSLTIILFNYSGVILQDINKVALFYFSLLFEYFYIRLFNIMKVYVYIHICYF